MPDSPHQDKIRVLEEEVKKWKSKCERAKSDLLMLVKEREDMENTLIGLRSYREDISKAQEVMVAIQDKTYQDKIEDLEAEVMSWKITYENQKLYAVKEKEQLNQLRNAIQNAKNAICSR